MKQAILDRMFPREREFQPVNHGLFRGCEMYLSMRDQFHLCYGTYEREIAEHFARLARTVAALSTSVPGKDATRST